MITCIGNTVQENFESLQQKRAGITEASLLQTSHKVPVGEIKLSNAELAKIAQASDLLPRTALLSIIAAKAAWESVQAIASQLRVGLISANTVGGMDLTEHFYTAYLQDPNSAPIAQVRHHECGAITNLTAAAIGHQGWRTTISTACSSAANSIMMGAKLIANNQYDIIIAGGADALSRFTLNGFNALMILDKELCQPFDQHRKGLNLGEGAAYIVMASDTVVQQFDLESQSYVSGYANANDAHHQTASSPEGKGNRLAMEQALAIAGLSPDDIQYINLHGTGTHNNDASEGAAISALFQNKVPPASSTKAFTGHTLAAAGAVEAVYATLAIEHQCTLPHLRLHTPMDDFSWQPIRIMEACPIQHVLSNSFGFGGNCSALVISKH
jgi:3-oxoacyl-[acyl-carrier-protein] synthase-1